ncbi:MAG: MBL fold metallo-hydrolase [Dehalococcoidia bacterium]|nr:MBL fold metallo-hydrolase [Dehalococcoidia bacterium]
MEMAPGVHRISEVTGSNVCLLAGEQMTLIDTGIQGNGEAIVSYIKSIGRTPSDLKYILLTHFHHDHSGSALELHEMTGAQIVTHKDEVEVGPDHKPMLRKGNEADSGRAPWWVSLLMGGRRRDGLVPHTTPVHMQIDHNDVIPSLGGLKILYTPGHTPGSISPYLEKEKVLFLGDSVLNNVDRLSRPMMYDRKRRMQLDASLKTLRGLEAEAASFGHGPPLKGDVMTKVRALTDRPYDLSTWRIVLKNWRTLRAFRASTKRRGHWSGAQDE